MTLKTGAKGQILYISLKYQQCEMPTGTGQIPLPTYVCQTPYFTPKAIFACQFQTGIVYSVQQQSQKY